MRLSHANVMHMLKSVDFLHSHQSYPTTTTANVRCWSKQTLRDHTDMTPFDPEPTSDAHTTNCAAFLTPSMKPSSAVSIPPLRSGREVGAKGEKKCRTL